MSSGAFAEASATVVAANHASAQKRASRMVGAPPVLPAPSRLLSCARCVNAFHARPRCVPARATPTASPDCLVCPDHALAPLHSHPAAAHSRLFALWRPSADTGAEDLLSSRDAQPLPLHLVGRTPVFAAPNSAAIAFGDGLGRAAAEAASTGALVRYVDVQRARAAALSEAVVAGAADAAGFGLRFEAPAGLSPRAAAYAEWEALAGLPEHDLGAAHAAGGLQLSPLQQSVSQALLLQVRACVREREGEIRLHAPLPPSPPLPLQLSANGGALLAAATQQQQQAQPPPPPPPSRSYGPGSWTRTPAVAGAPLAPAGGAPGQSETASGAAPVSAPNAGSGAPRVAAPAAPPAPPAAPPPPLLPDPDTFDTSQVLAPLPDASLAVVVRLLAAARQADAAEKARRAAPDAGDGPPPPTQMSHVVHTLQVWRGRRGGSMGATRLDTPNPACLPPPAPLAVRPVGPVRCCGEPAAPTRRRGASRPCRRAL